MSSEFSWMRLIPLVISVGLLAGGALVYRSDYLQVQALQGNKTVEQYRKLIGMAAEYNHDARTRYADVLYHEGKTTAAIEMLQSSHAGKFNWQGWDRMGQFYESLAFSATGTTEELRIASQYYDEALQVNPARPGVIKRRAVLALKEGNWSKALEMAQALDDGAAGSSDASYVRAQVALAAGETTQAMGYFERIAVAEDRSSATLFRLSQVETALRNGVRQ